MYNNNDCSDESGSSWPTKLRVLRVDALSAGEWNYLFGLFLTDGYSHMNKGTKFCFTSGEEEELARRVEGLMKRASLKPKVMFDKRKRMVNVFVYSKALHLFLPSKGSFGVAAEWERFLGESKLLTVEFGVPFVAGLMDGDGSCCVYARRKTPFLGNLDQYRWSFGQKKYPFLIDYLKRFVEALAPNSVYLYMQSGREANLFIRKSGVEALLEAGITGYSWKAARWLGKVTKLRMERMKYYTASQAAKVLHVSVCTVKNWIKRGKLRGVGGVGRAGRDTWRYILAEEVERFRKMLRLQREDRRVERAKNGGMKIAEVSKLLSIPQQMLYSWYRRGELQATLVHEEEKMTPGGHAYFMIPRAEVERLKRKLCRSEDCWECHRYVGWRTQHIALLGGFVKSNLTSRLESRNHVSGLGCWSGRSGLERNFCLMCDIRSGLARDDDLRPLKFGSC